ncbi:MAG: prepilin-type cleavage/methylation domain-containing protein [Nannocystaceae bacterium]|nr:prepilin-type cleavage/methylation domain-containing protein [Nannocystaceae bacterium]
MQQQPPYPPQPPYPQQHGYPPQHGHPPKKKGLGCGAIVAICAAVSIPVLGMLAAIAVPAFTKYMRRAKTAEARVQLAKLFDSMANYHTEHGRCPGALAGDTDVTPPTSLNCNVGQGGRCNPGDAYPSSDWADNEVWSALGFEMSSPHYFHYNVRWSQDSDGACQFTAQAFGDLDDDGVFSTFERFGAADINGVNGAAGLYIDQEVE